MAIDPSDWPIDPYTVDGVELADRLNAVIPSEFNALNNGKANLAGGNIFTGVQTFGTAGSATRLSGDLSNANQNLRLLFQTNIVNGATSLGVIPNGTAAISNFTAYAAADAANAAYIQMGFNGAGQAVLNTSVLGSSTQRELMIQAAGVDRIRLRSDNVVDICAGDAGGYYCQINLRSVDNTRHRYFRMDSNNDLQFTNNANSQVTHVFANGGDLFCAGRLRSGYQGGGEAMFQHVYDAPSGTVGSSIWESSRNISVGLSYFPTGAVACWNPGTDNTTLCGWGFGRWSSVWATNGTIQTSDAREKTPVRNFNEAELAVAMSLAEEVGFYKWLSDIDAKGEDAVWMCGQTAQFIQARFAEHGLDVKDYGILIYEDYSVYEGVMNPQGKQDEDGNLIEPLLGEGAPRDRWSANYANLNQFLIRGLRENQMRMEARLAKLEALLKG